MANPHQLAYCSAPPFYSTQIDVACGFTAHDVKTRATKAAYIIVLVFNQILHFYCIYFRMSDIEEDCGDLSCYSSHPSEYTFSSGKLKKLHFCAKSCKKNKRGKNCFQKIYSTLNPKAVYLICPPDCQFVKKFPEVMHRCLTLAPEETLVGGLPFIDTMKEKLRGQSWETSFTPMIKYLSGRRSPCLDDYKEIKSSDSLFSVTIGKTTDSNTVMIIDSFISRLKKSAIKLFPDMVCGFDVEGQQSHKTQQGHIPAILRRFWRSTFQ